MQANNYHSMLDYIQQQPLFLTACITMCLVFLQSCPLVTSSLPHADEISNEVKVM